MTFRVVLDERASVMGRRAKRGISVITGATLGLVGVIAAVPAFVLTFGGLLVVIVSAMSEEPVDLATIADGLTAADLWLWWAISCAATAIGLGVGVRLLRGRRHLVLFLRRFGHTEATGAVTQATARIGARWRLVTLDDAQIAPVGVTAGSRGYLRVGRGLGGAFQAVSWIATKIGGPLMTLAFIGAIGSLVLIVAGGDPGHAGALTDWTIPATTTELLVFRICAGIVAAGFVVMVVGLAVGLVAVVLTPLFAALSSVADAIREAEQNKAVAVPDAAAIAPAKARILEQSRRVFSARLFVLKVDSSVWQATVSQFAAVSTVPLIDISDPTEHIVWEIEQLTRRFGQRCVVVGQYDRIGRLFDHVQPGTVNARVLALLDGVEVLGYTTDDDGRRRFARSLRVKLDAHARLPRPSPAGAVPTQPTRGTDGVAAV